MTAGTSDEGAASQSKQQGTEDDADHLRAQVVRSLGFTVEAQGTGAVAQETGAADPHVARVAKEDEGTAADPDGEGEQPADAGFLSVDFTSQHALVSSLIF